MTGTAGFAAEKIQACWPGCRAAATELGDVIQLDHNDSNVVE